MSLPHINPGLLWVSSTGVANGAFYYPDPQGFDTGPPANSAYLSNDVSLCIFAISDRSAIIRSIWLDATGTTNYPKMWIGPHAGSDVTLDLVAPEVTGATFTYGPEGILMPGGFQIYLPANASTMNFTIAYEVV